MIPIDELEIEPERHGEIWLHALDTGCHERAVEQIDETDADENRDRRHAPKPR